MAATENKIANATATDIDSILGVSMRQLRKSYETLDDKVYFTVYDDVPVAFYCETGLKTRNAQNVLRYLIVNMMSSGKETPAIVYKIKGLMNSLPAELIINSNFAVFKAFPEKSYPLFMEERMLLRAMESGRIDINYDKPNVLVAVTADKDDDKFYFESSENVKYGFGYKGPEVLGGPLNGPPSEHIARWKAEEARLMKLYYDKVPFENVKNTFINTMLGTVKASKAKNWTHGVYTSYTLKVAAEDMKNHPKKVEDKDYTGSLAAYEKLAKESYPKWEDFVKKQWLEYYATLDLDDGTIEMPKAGSSNPKLEAEMLAIAKTIYDDGRVPVKAILEYADWAYHRNAFGVILYRYHVAYIIYKMKDGTQRVVDLSFKQQYNGSSYGKTEHMGVGIMNRVLKTK